MKLKMLFLMMGLASSLCATAPAEKAAVEEKKTEEVAVIEKTTTEEAPKEVASAE